MLKTNKTDWFGSVAVVRFWIFFKFMTLCKWLSNDSAVY